MLSVIRRLLFAGLAAAAGPALAHGGHEHVERPGWSFEPLVIVPLAIVLLVFLAGQWRLAKRSRIERRRSWLFLGGWLTLALALTSPLHEGGERSFTLHMVEHELIMLLATLLLALSHSGGILAWGLPAPLRNLLGGQWKRPLSALWRRLTEPVTATIIQAVVMWAWHAPALFDRALASSVWHIGQHVSFILASLIFWSAMLGRRQAYILSAACLFLTSLVEGALGALMSLSSSPWYSAYAAMGISGIGLDPATDQQLAGLIMWVPGGVVHAGAALALLYHWLISAEGRSITKYR